MAFPWLSDFQGSPVDPSWWLNKKCLWWNWSFLVYWWVLPKKWKWSILCWVCEINSIQGFKTAPSPLATSPQQVELDALTQAWIFVEGKTAHIYTDSQYVFGVAHDFRMLWEQWNFLTSSGDKIKTEPYVWNLLDAVLLPGALAIIKVSGHCKSESLQVRANHLADTSAKNTALMRFVDLYHSPKDYSPWRGPKGSDQGITTASLWRGEANWKAEGCWYSEEKGLWFGPVNKPLLPGKSKNLPLLTTVCELNHWSTEKMVTSMSQYWWGNISKATENACLAPSVLNSTQGNLFAPPRNILVYPVDHLRPGRWVSYSCPHLTDIICSSNGLYVFTLDWSISM